MRPRRLVAVVGAVHQRAPETTTRRQAQEQHGAAEGEGHAQPVLTRFFGTELRGWWAYFSVAHGGARIDLCWSARHRRADARDQPERRAIAERICVMPASSRALSRVRESWLEKPA